MGDMVSPAVFMGIFFGLLPEFPENGIMFCRIFISVKEVSFFKEI